MGKQVIKRNDIANSAKDSDGFYLHSFNNKECKILKSWFKTEQDYIDAYENNYIVLIRAERWHQDGPNAVDIGTSSFDRLEITDDEIILYW